MSKTAETVAFFPTPIDGHTPCYAGYALGAGKLRAFRHRACLPRRAGFRRWPGLPAFVHPDPLLGATPDGCLERERAGGGQPDDLSLAIRRRRVVRDLHYLEEVPVSRPGP